MAKSVKLTNNTYIDWSGISCDRKTLKTILTSTSLIGVDLNDYRKTGFYYFMRDCTNAPDNYLYCLVFGNGGEPTVQIGINMGGNDPYIYYRSYANSRWSSWKKVSASLV